ncbi:MAG: hypothetical protein EPO52_10725 [Herbiconiux sp.]|uniref:hypothetical protein n=1 Tax=Herbiconiux sp. TaxID=1871186 RepID=UPI001213C786|nr:hypothetical protein [Herbiconiux sp.]TAJ48584.1 MAG: hypothetical protein EPO52_10725 [Herbiconiux sp.]
MTVLTDRTTDPAVPADQRDVRLGRVFSSRAPNEIRNDAFERGATSRDNPWAADAPLIIR